MKQPNTCLTLVAPLVFEEELVDRFSKRSDGVGGFTLTHVEGYSHEGGPRDAAEQVHGRGPRVRLEILLDHDDAIRIVDELRRDVARPDIAYWITRVVDFGRLG